MYLRLKRYFESMASDATGKISQNLATFKTGERGGRQKVYPHPATKKLPFLR